MKKSTLALMVMGVVASASVHAAEVYNKNGNKLDVYGKVKAMHYISENCQNLPLRFLIPRNKVFRDVLWQLATGLTPVKTFVRHHFPLSLNGREFVARDQEA